MESITEQEITVVSIDEIICTKELQVRARIDTEIVQTYVSKYENGEEMPPLTVAELSSISGADFRGYLHLIDGWHRLEALRVLKQGTVKVIILRGLSPQEAGYEAAMANLMNGKPLSPSEYPQVFRCYMWADKWKDGKGKAKGLRTIAKDLHGIISHMCVKRWLQAEFREVYAMHYEQDIDVVEAGDMTSKSNKKIPYNKLPELRMTALLKQAKDAFSEIESLRGKKRMLKLYRQVLKTMTEA